ncbi:unnamed protein product [Hapterophycus canaliculatus]
MEENVVNASSKRMHMENISNNSLCRSTSKQWRVERLKLKAEGRSTLTTRKMRESLSRERNQPTSTSSNTLQNVIDCFCKLSQSGHANVRNVADGWCLVPYTADRSPIR